MDAPRSDSSHEQERIPQPSAFKEITFVTPVLLGNTHFPPVIPSEDF